LILRDLNVLLILASLLFGKAGEGCMKDDRFANLETVVSFHEDTIQKLNDVVYKQQLMIDRLEERVESLIRLIQSPGNLPYGEKEQSL
jgi:uncharacterized coiled-coil protein SlyX